MQSLPCRLGGADATKGEAAPLSGSPNTVLLMAATCEQLADHFLGADSTIKNLPTLLYANIAA